MEKKRIVILGSSGSIGTQALKAIEGLENYTISGVGVKSNIDVLEQQARRYNIPFAVVFDENKEKILKTRLNDAKTQVFGGLFGICKMIRESGADIVLNSIMGMAGLIPTLTAIDCGCDIALANKEALVSGGSLVMQAAKKRGVKILPVDSEHSAIFQCLQGQGDKAELKKIILTASGGPFFGWDEKAQADITPQMALKHPNWSMGKKITIDSATLMNKGLELIEAMHLFCVESEKIEILIHKESIIHSAVEFVDNSIIAQMSVPDMALSISYALNYPNRKENSVKELDLAEIGSLSFSKPDIESFRCLKIAIEASKKLGTAPVALNGANEAAVEMFLNKEIKFTHIAKLVQNAVLEHNFIKNPTLDEIIRADMIARRSVLNNISL